MVFMALLILSTLFQRLPRALDLLHAVLLADETKSASVQKKKDHISVPEHWKSQNGPHLYVTEDEMLLCRPVKGGGWDFVDINAVWKEACSLPKLNEGR